ncbi:MAG: RNA chaperone Hfq [Trichlorobacter sp.]|nr:RNA chaperone Hfq [Trichlorobacter sp.]
MAKAVFNVQDQFLNQVRRESVQLKIKMMSGEVIQGTIKSFDNFCLLLDANGDMLVYKHAIAEISAAKAGFRLQQQ